MYSHSDDAINSFLYGRNDPSLGGNNQHNPRPASSVIYTSLGTRKSYSKNLNPKKNPNVLGITVAELRSHLTQLNNLRRL